VRDEAYCEGLEGGHAQPGQVSGSESGPGPPKGLRRAVQGDGKGNTQVLGTFARAFARLWTVDRGVAVQGRRLTVLAGRPQRPEHSRSVVHCESRLCRQSPSRNPESPPQHQPGAPRKVCIRFACDESVAVAGTK
jgi:hypothetical protein